MKKTELAYIAGIFDGEGCISISKLKPTRGYLSNYYTLKITLKMANSYIPQLLRFAFGGSFLKEKKRPDRRECWAWSVTSNNAINFLQQIFPYLKLKQNEAELALKFQIGKRAKSGGKRTDAELAIEEAQYILMHTLKDKSCVEIFTA